jgi:hypothetical protein
MAIHIRRRDFISLLGGSAAAWPLVARRAMPDRIRRIGYLGFGPASPYATRVDARRTGLRELGWIEGKNIVIEFRWADRVDELPALAAELVRMHVDVIFASSSPWSCRVNLPNAPRRWPSLRRHRTSGWPRPRRKGRKRGRVFIEYTWPNLTTLDFPEIGAPGRTTAKSRSKWLAPMLRSRKRER